MPNYDKVPVEYMKSDVKNYIENGTIYGNFLYSLFCNDLMMVYTHADKENKRNLDEWTIFLYNYAPKDCWGSEEKVKNWDGL